MKGIDIVVNCKSLFKRCLDFARHDILFARHDILLFFVCCSLFAVEVKQDETIRFAVWAEADAYPGMELKTENQYELPVEQLKKIAPFFISGMVYGFSFDYTPSDRARKVQEYFEFTPIHEFSPEEKRLIEFEKPWFEDNKVWCWVRFVRHEEYQKFYKSWATIRTPRIRGVGYGKLSAGFSGLEEAFGDAMKNAIREYERKIIKNKPKAVTGKILVNEPPLIGVDAGRYKITLDFFLETDKIIEYTKF